MPDAVMIEVLGAGKRYGRRRPVDALRDVSLSIPRGRVTAVVGPNGAGKSTLFGILLGFLHASSGEIRIDGDDPRGYVHDHGIGYMPDRFSLPSSWPVHRALHAFSRMNGLAPAQSAAALESFGLTDWTNRKVGELSRGLVQRLGLALAFAPGRDLVVLDEPAEGLDPLWRIRLRDRIAAERNAGHTVMVASHDIAEVALIADTVIVLDHGMVKEVVDNNSSRQSLGYRITVAAAGPEPGDLLRLFPDAVRIEQTADDDVTWDVSVDDPADLNRRIAALIELGFTISSFHPRGPDLEAQVRRVIET